MHTLYLRKYNTGKLHISVKAGCILLTLILKEKKGAAARPCPFQGVA
jgi:hypothetical protein